MVHGSTVATNAVLEGKGVPAAYITNKGLTDVLSIGQQAIASNDKDLLVCNQLIQLSACIGAIKFSGDIPGNYLCH